VEGSSSQGGNRIHSQKTVVSMAQRSKSLQGLDNAGAGLPVGHEEQVGLVQLDPVLDRLQGEVRPRGCVQLLDVGALPPRHVRAPHPKNFLG